MILMFKLPKSWVTSPCDVRNYIRNKEATIKKRENKYQHSQNKRKYTVMSDDKANETQLDNADERALLNETDREADGQTVADEKGDAVKFTNGEAATARVDIEGQTKLDDTQFVGLSKEELLKYASDPYWIKVRWILLIIFWVAWFAMLAAAVVIIVLAPKCPPRKDLDWWQKSVIYQVYPRSLKDTNDDGLGDIKGIEEKLEYFESTLQVGALHINSLYPSGGKDTGNDVTDFKNVSSEFGSLEDFENMRVAMHKKGLKLIVDFIPNHSSKDHPWFKESSASSDADNKYRDYYVWHAGKAVDGQAKNDPPNNWLSVYGGSAWTYDETRGEYYLHQFLSDQPELNLRNDKVREELKDILMFWLEQGVDGFYVDSAAYLFENASFANEAVGDSTVDQNDYYSLLHNQTKFQAESYQIFTEWRELIEAFSSKDGKSRFLQAGATGTPEQILGFYEYDGKPTADMAVSGALVELKSGCDATCINQKITDWIMSIPEDPEEETYWTNWMLGSQESSRIATSYGQDWVNPLNILVMTLPGTPSVYYGQEIGMHDVQVDDSSKVDPMGRDRARTPMQWDTSENAGFTKGTPWLPVADDYQERNVQAQQAHGAGTTNLEVFANITGLKKEPSVQWGSIDSIVVTSDILSFTRQAEGFPGYLVVINFGTGDASTLVNCHSGYEDKVPAKGKVVANTGNFDTHSRAEEYKIGTEVSLDAMVLKPKEGIVFKWEKAPEGTGTTE